MNTATKSYTVYNTSFQCWPQDDARSLAASKGGGKEGKDKRNLYLAKEGDIPKGTPAWVGMSEHDRSVAMCLHDV